MDGRAWPALRIALATSVVALGLVAPALGQVIEVGPGGVSKISAPSIITAEGARPIARPSAASPQIAPAAPGLAAPLLDKAGTASALSPRLLEAIAYVESRFDTRAISPKGAVGMMQLMPKTAASLGVDPANPEANARGGADYLRKLLVRFDNNVELAVAAYNAGPEAVTRHGGVPPYPETRAYVAAVMDYLARTSVPETR
ncbi:MAG TPA: lytic transglycosylase domain-containing protein [Hyphomonadaceae bacterium]|nr:lytic transglycosylase domain-containing protein [Hyphomonadaceae bacterium]